MTEIQEGAPEGLVLSDIPFGRNEAARQALWLLQQEHVHHLPASNRDEVDIARRFAREKLSFLLPPKQLLSVAEADGELLGAVLAAKPAGSPRGGILWIVTDHRHRSLGIGSALLERAEQRLAALGATTAVLDAKGSATGFFKKQGYTDYPSLKKRRLGTDYRNPLGKNLPARLQ